MLELIIHHFSLKHLRDWWKNRHLSFFVFYDKYTVISDKCRIQRSVVIRKSTINEYSYIGHNTNINNTTIGKYCSFSKNIIIGIGTHPTNFVSTSPLFFTVRNGTGYSWITEDKFDDTPAPVTIGNDVWVGLNSSIMGGVTVGNGAIIAAHSVVTKDVPPYAIVGGVPAKIIKYRFSEEIIAQLEELKWWDMPEEVLKKSIHHFQTTLTPVEIENIRQDFKNYKR